MFTTLYGVICKKAVNLHNNRYEKNRFIIIAGFPNFFPFCSILNRTQLALLDIDVLPH